MAFPSAPEQDARRSRRIRPQLPRLVDQMRILTWFQFHLTLVTLVVAIVLGAVLSGHDLSYTSVDDPVARQLGRVEVLILVLAGTAILLAVAAALVRRGFMVAFPLVILAEVAVLVDVGLAVRTGVILGLVAVLLLILGGWILADLFRREVRTFLIHSPRR
jgi:hypothetical protein